MHVQILLGVKGKPTMWMDDIQLQDRRRGPWRNGSVDSLNQPSVIIMNDGQTLAGTRIT